MLRFHAVQSSMLPTGFKAWKAEMRGFSFVITYEPLTGSGFEKYSGYTASWKSRAADMTAFGKQPSNKIDGGPWASFVLAESKCESTYKQLRTRN